MDATLASAPRAAPPPPAARAGVPWLVPAVLFAATSVVVGVLWDISWHQSIGRDTFWTPAHLAIYTGGVVAGVACGAHVLRLSFGGASPEERAATVTWWRFFRGPLGAWVCIWGALAMLTSAPFDDWWHNAYGLDVKILSPPHTVLALGIQAIVVGALLMVLARQNRSEAEAGPARAAYRWMYAYAVGLVLANYAIMTSEYGFRTQQHGTLFYQVAALVFPLGLVSAAVAGRLRWPATASALVYSGVVLAMMYLLPLFPAEPRLGPVLYPLRRMVPPQFPLLLVVPALAVDLVLRAWGERRRGWTLALVLSAAFLLPFLAAQWPFASFLLSGTARGSYWWGQSTRPYFVGPEARSLRGAFLNPASGVALARGLAVALGIGVLSARVGLALGGWKRRVLR